MLDHVWYKVRHPWFDPTCAYRAVAYTLHSESSWAYLTFILATGHTVAVQVHRCTALPFPIVTLEGEYVRPLSREASEFPWARKLAVPNPDLDLDMQ